jgi:hypothetical protein
MVKKKQNFVYKTGGPKTEIVDHVAGLVDPFHPSSKDKKIHDANGSKTFTFSSIGRFGIPTGASGNGYAEFYPALASNSAILQGNTNIGSNGLIPASPNFTVSNLPEYTDLAATTARWRIVSWGLRITSLENALDAKGQIMIREVTEENQSQNDDVFAYTEEYTTLPITHNMDYVVIPNHLADSYTRFMPPGVPYATMLSDNALEPGYKAIGITIIGATAGDGTATSPSLINVEVVYNLELLPLVGTFGVRISTDPAPHDYTVIQAAHNTRASLPLVVKKPSLWQTVKGLASRALHTGAEMFLGKAGGMLSDYITGLGKKHLPMVKARTLPLLTNG